MSSSTTTAALNYVIAYEAGAEHPRLPTWASHQDNPAQLAAKQHKAVTRNELDNVPGAFQLLDVLSAAECTRLMAYSEALGYLPDAAVSLPRAVRHNDNVVWIADTHTQDVIWQRIAAAITDLTHIVPNQVALGVNARWRFYRYGVDDYFKPHRDGAWPGSDIVDGQLLANAYSDRYSQMSFLIFLSDDFTGGATRFYCQPHGSSRVASNSQPTTAEFVDVRTPQGAVLCFPHGNHPWHCVHSSEPIQTGVKYIIRSDLLFGH